MQSLKLSTVKQAPAYSIIQLGQCAQRQIVTLADNYDKNTPFRFAKLDIKDGYWRLEVSNTDSCNFCDVLLQSKKVENI